MGMVLFELKRETEYIPRYLGVIICIVQHILLSFLLLSRLDEESVSIRNETPFRVEGETAQP